MSDENRNIGKELSKLFADFKDYLDIKYNLFKIGLSEQLVSYLSASFTFYVVAVLAMFVLLFFSIAGALYLGEILSSIPLGFMAVGFIYFILIILFLILKKVLVINPLTRFVINMFFKKD